MNASVKEKISKLIDIFGIPNVIGWNSYRWHLEDKSEIYVILYIIDANYVDISRQNAFWNSNGPNYSIASTPSNRINLDDFIKRLSSEELKEKIIFNLDLF